MTFHQVPNGAHLLLCAWQLFENVSTKELAARIGCARTSLSRLRAGTSRPTLATALCIERITEGAVPAAAWDAPKRITSIVHAAMLVLIKRHEGGGLESLLVDDITGGGCTLRSVPANATSAC